MPQNEKEAPRKALLSEQSRGLGFESINHALNGIRHFDQRAPEWLIEKGSVCEAVSHFDVEFVAVSLAEQRRHPRNYKFSLQGIPFIQVNKASEALHVGEAHAGAIEPTSDRQPMLIWIGDIAKPSQKVISVVRLGPEGFELNQFGMQLDRNASVWPLSVGSGIKLTLKPCEALAHGEVGSIWISGAEGDGCRMTGLVESVPEIPDSSIRPLFDFVGCPLEDAKNDQNIICQKIAFFHHLVWLCFEERVSGFNEARDFLARPSQYLPGFFE